LNPAQETLERTEQAPESEAAAGAPDMTPSAPISARSSDREPALPAEVVFEVKGVSVAYDDKPAVRDISMDIGKHRITALIGPSGCGKSTLIRCFNRMNDLVPGATVTGELLFHGQDLYAEAVDPVEVRKLIGMVFQKPNPFPKSIYDNIAFGPRVVGMKDDLDGIVEQALKRAALWDEVRDRLGENAYRLSGGQQQRLCIARCLAVQPDVLLMDEPCSALDPIATAKIEDLMLELKRHYSIVIVTHNMQQAGRVSDMTAVLMPEVTDSDDTIGHIVEYADTSKIFTNPESKRTEDYVTGRVG
jgi:phosphate transport system ATP-binding protein